VSVALDTGPYEAMDALKLLREALATVTRARGMRAKRLLAADTSVSFHVDGAGSVVLVLYGDAPTVAEDDGMAEIELALSPEQARAFASGRLGLPCALLAGDIAYRGPARKFLSVAGIVNGLIDDGGRVRA
jgi:hypothetical protein